MELLLLICLCVFNAHTICKGIDPQLTALKLVIGGEPFVENMVGKDVVVFLGHTQVGKSTTINALLGIQFVRDSKTQFRTLTPIGEKEIKAQMSSTEDSGKSCTMLPSTYSSDSSPFAFVDTRGFFNVQEDENGDVAAAVLLGMALKNAASVRVVFLMRCGDLSRGIAYIEEMGVILNKIVAGVNQSVFFLFNNFQENKHETEMMLSYEGGKQAYIKKIIGDDIIRINKSLDHNSEEYDKNYKKMQFVELLWRNYERGNWGYIDPLDALSVNSVSEALIDSPPINVEALKIGEYNRVQSKFDTALAEHINSILPIMNRKWGFINFTLPLIDVFIGEYERILLKRKGLLKKLDDGNLSEEFKNEVDKSIETYKGKVEKEIQDLKIRRSSLHQEITEIKEANLTRCKGENYFRDDCPRHMLWRNHEITIDTSGAPIRAIERVLGGNTRADTESKLGTETDDSSAKYTKMVITETGLGNISKTVITETGKDTKIFADNDFYAWNARDCTGKIDVFVYPREVRENQKLIEHYEAQIKKFNNMISGKEKEKLRLETSDEEKLRERLVSVINATSRRIDALHKECKAFLRRSIDDYSLIERDVVSFASVIGKLYGGQQEKLKKELQRTIPEFMQLYQRIDKRKTYGRVFADVENVVSRMMSEVNLFPLSKGADKHTGEDTNTNAKKKDLERLPEKIEKKGPENEKEI